MHNFDINCMMHSYFNADGFVNWKYIANLCFQTC